jgi:hypothetical protein
VGRELEQVVDAEIIEVAPDLERHRPITADRAADERPLSAGAQRLVIAGVPTSTLAAYASKWEPFAAWCEKNDLAARPAAESTMIEYLHSWESLPVHVRCLGGRQSNGTKCTGHRPAPSSMWIWYSAVRFYHSMATPTFAWYGGKKLALAMKAYREEMTRDLGWTPNQAPRAWPEHVMAMIDSCDLADPKDLRDRALALVGWYTGARASDLATYRIGDVTFTPLGVDLRLVASKTNKAVGKVVERRVLRPDEKNPAYCAVKAVEAWVGWLRAHEITSGALFRPFGKPGKSGIPVLLRGHRDGIGYRMSGTSISEVIAELAVRAGVPDGEWFTQHSLRRGRATHLRSLGVDQLSIARALGWARYPPPAYMEEAEAFDDAAPAAIGLLG